MKTQKQRGGTQKTERNKHTSQREGKEAGRKRKRKGERRGREKKKRRGGGKGGRGGEQCISTYNGGLSHRDAGKTPLVIKSKRYAYKGTILVIYADFSATRKKMQNPITSPKYNL